MKQSDLWIYFVVTMVTLLIWLWAAGETRQERTITNVKIQYVASDSENWIISPGGGQVGVVVQGSRLAMDKIEKLLRRPLRLTVSAMLGQQAIDLAQQIRELPDIRETGATIRAVEPTTQELSLDHIEYVSAPVRAILPKGAVVDDLKADPAEVKLAMPSDLQKKVPKDLSVEALIDAAAFEQLTRGEPQTMDVLVHVPEWLTYLGNVTVTPPRVKLSFTVRKRQADIMLASVPVKVADAASDQGKFVSEIIPSVLKDVTITAESELIRRIATGEVPVVAMLHLSDRDKADQVNAKAVSCFIALVPGPNGLTEGTIVKGRVGDSPDPPIVQFRVKDR